MKPKHAYPMEHTECISIKMFPIIKKTESERPFRLIHEYLPIPHHDMITESHIVMQLVNEAVMCHEISSRSDYFDGDVDWGTVVDGNENSNQRDGWFDENSNPVEDIQNAVAYIVPGSKLREASTTIKLFLGRDAYRALKNHPSIVKLLGIVDKPRLAGLLKVAEVIEAPLASGLYGEVLPGRRNALVACVSDDMDKIFGIGYTIVRSGIEPNPDKIPISEECESTLRNYGMEIRRSSHTGRDYIDIKWSVSSCLASKESGYFFKNIVSGKRLLNLDKLAGGTI